MTSYWGPLGWMTLHSASLLYPISPQPAEKLLMSQFIDMFGDTISCYHCKTHFNSMKAKYIAWNPEYLSSRKEFMLFVFRCHNAVNKRLDKPILQSVPDCITALKNADSYSSLSSLRNAYFTYLSNNWGKEHTSDGFAIRKKVHELIKINNEYFNLRNVDWTYTFNESVLPINDTLPPVQVRKKVGGFKNGKLLM